MEERLQQKQEKCNNDLNLVAILSAWYGTVCSVCQLKQAGLSQELTGCSKSTHVVTYTHCIL